MTNHARVPTIATLWIAAATAASANPGHTPDIGDWGVDLGGRDRAVRAQDDFFRHANGKWLDTFAMPEDLGSYGSFTALFLQAEEQVHAIVQEAAAAKAPAGGPSQKIGDLYSDFVDESAIETAGMTPIAPELERIAALATHEDVARYLATAMRRGGSTPFTYYVDQDEKNPARYVPHFYQAGLGLPDRDYYLVEENEQFRRAREAYRAYLEKMLGFAGASDPAASAERVYTLEKHLAESHWPSADTRDVDRTYNLLARANVVEMAPGFAWNEYLDGLGLAKDLDVIVMMPTAYAGMAEIFSETPVSTWQDYLRYWLVRDTAALLPRDVDDTHFAFTSALSGAKKQRDRWKRGVQFVNQAMGEAVGRLYVERHFPASSKAQVSALVDNLLKAFDERIDTLEWMSPETKKRANEKLTQFTVKVGYPDEWRDYSKLVVKRGDLVGNARRAASFEYDRDLAKFDKPVDRNEWLMSPQVVNAYYNPNMNEIVFPAAILQPPFFDPNADDAVNYGGIGMVIGHEIGHGFDDQGRKSDGTGHLTDWWTAEDAARFDERANVLVTQYDGYSPIDGMTINGRLTLGENIGDLGGLEIAHYAYRLSLGGKPAPVIDGLTGDQRFFLGFSQIWRGKIRDEAMASLLASNPHSPVEYRVNGTLRNVDAWYDAFDVKPGDDMYLPEAERVRIW